jgi:heavy metal translocating P-type ATPase
MNAPPACDFCGLPVSGRIDSSSIPPAAPQYCCFGCRFAAEVTRSGGEQGINRALMLKLGTAVFCTMNVVAFTMFLWAPDVFGERDTGELAIALEEIFRYLGLLFSLPVLLLLGGPLLQSACSDLRRGIAATDLLVCVGVLAAFGFSVGSVVRGSGPVYFEVACVVLVLITLGRWMEAQGKLQATAALQELESLLPTSVRRIRSGVDETVPAGQIEIDDLVRVLPGERLPTDGRIVSGMSHVDQQMLTGESLPVERSEGDWVLGGSLALDGELRILVTAPIGHGALSRLLDALREARVARGHYQRLADRIAAWFLPAVFVISIVATIVHSNLYGLDQGVLAGLSVALIACPCALGLATPLAVWTALGTAARHQVLFRSGEVLERLAGIRAIVWDKTGTLTTGTAVVERLEVDGGDYEDVVRNTAVAIARSSTHPFARAIVSDLATSTNCRFRNTRQVPGSGLIAERLDGDRVLLGSVAFVGSQGFSISDSLRDAAETAMNDGAGVSLVGWSGRVRGVFVFSERLRPDAMEAVAWFRRRGVAQRMLTGDHRNRAAKIAPQLGFRDESEWQAELLPEGKALAVQDLRRQFGSVGMVGDGVNDAPALARSDVGITVSSGTDVSRETSGVCLFGDDLHRLPWACEFSRRAVNIIRQNLFWAFAYNSVGVGLACGGFLNPTIAAVLMAGSSLFVVTNSLRLTRFDLGESTANDSNPPVIEPASGCSPAILPDHTDESFAVVTSSEEGRS